MDRDCDKCVYHTAGSCSKFDCEFTTVADIRNKAIDDFEEAIDKEDREEPLVLDMCTIEEIAERLKGDTE